MTQSPPSLAPHPTASAPTSTLAGGGGAAGPGVGQPLPVQPVQSTPAVHLTLLVVQVLFASFSPVGKIALRELPALALAPIRVTLGAAAFALLWLVVRPERVARRDLGRLALYSVFGVTANQLLFLAGLERTTATTAVVLGTSIPVFTAVAALALGREQATGLKLGGLAVALAGALVITGAAHAAPGALVGNALILVNSAAYAIYLVISRDLLQRMSPLTAMTVVFGFGALFTDLLVGVGGALGLLPLAPATIPSLVAHLGPQGARALAYIVAGPTVAAYLLNAIALRAVPASLVAVYIYVQPVIGALLAALLLGERPTAHTLVGGLAIFAGIGLVNLDRLRDRGRDRAGRAKREARG